MILEIINVVLFVNEIFKHKLYKYIMEKINNFLKTYENTLKQIYITAYKEHNMGILFIDINNNNEGMCNTKYISVHNLPENLNDIKYRILNNHKIFYCLINNDENVFIERDY